MAFEPTNSDISFAGDEEAWVKRFLHYGSIRQMYSASSSTVAVPFYNLDNLAPFQSLLSSTQTERSVIVLIKKVLDDGFYIDQKALLYALAFVIKTANENVKHEAYQIVPLLTKTSDDFLLFNVYFEHHQKRFGIRKGRGQGWKKFVKAYYNSKTLLQFADLLTRNGLHHWNHIKVLRSSKVSLDDTCKQKLYLKLAHGYTPNDSETLCSDIPEMDSAVVDYVNDRLKLKHSNSSSEMMNFMEKYQFAVDQCLDFRLRHCEEWLKLISLMDANTLIRNLVRLSNKGLINKHKEILSSILKKFDVTDSSIHPSAIYLVMRRIEREHKLAVIYRAGQILKEQRAKSGTEKSSSKSRKRPMVDVPGNGEPSNLHLATVDDENDVKNEPTSNATSENLTSNADRIDLHLLQSGDAPSFTKLDSRELNILQQILKNQKCVSNPLLSEHLTTLSLNAAKSLNATGLKYLIIIENRSRLEFKQCSGSPYLSIQEATIVIAMCIVKAETENSVKMVTVCYDNDATGNAENAIKQIHVDKQDTFRTFKDKLLSIGKNVCVERDKEAFCPTFALQLMTEKFENFDVVVILCDNRINTRHTAESFEKYRQAVNHRVKLLICSLNGIPADPEHITGENMFLMCGFDVNVCSLIEAFCRGAF